MQRYTAQALLLQRQLGVRQLSTTTPLFSKASKDRSSRKPKSFSSPPPSAAFASAPAPGQAGTDVGKSGTSQEGESIEEVTPETIEEQFKKNVREDKTTDEDRMKENQAGTDIGGGGRGNSDIQNGPSIKQASERIVSKGEVIYTAQPPYNVALIMSAAFVVGVFCFVTADLARIGIAVYNEETGEYEVAPKWKRYTLAFGAAGVGTAAVAWGTLAPSRLVTRMVLHRSPTSLNSQLLFPPDSTISIYSPLTKLSSKLGVKPRQVPLSRIRLLGPISDSPKPYHPLFQTRDNKKEGKIFSFISRFMPSSPRTASSAKSLPTPWSKTGKKLSHSPILIEGDRASYSLALKRVKEMDSDKGAWAKDWDQLERALLGVSEEKWSARR